MSDFVLAVHTLLAADATLTTTLTGGVLLYRSLGVGGLSRSSSPAAYTSAGVLKPTLVLKGRALLPFGGLQDMQLQYLSARQVIELWFYDHLTWTTIRTARDRAYSLLHGTMLDTGGRLHWFNRLEDDRDPQMQGAAFLRDDYEVFGGLEPA